MKQILVIDDHRLIYDGLVASLGTTFYIRYASNLKEALAKLKEHYYAFVIIDITIENELGFSLVPSLPEDCIFFFLTMHCSSFYIKKAIQTGAKGFFLKDESMKILERALKNPSGRDFWMSDTVCEELKKQPECAVFSYDDLTPREQEIFLMLARGMEYKEIGYALNISSKTVNNHRTNIMKKMDVRNQAELVKEAVRVGLISI